MADALRLTRSGDLMGATALLRSALGDGPPPTAPSPPWNHGEVIDLVAERVTVTPKAAPAPAPAGAGGQAEECSYRGSEGRLDYRLYRPARAAAGMPLVVMLHGCTQSPEDFARGTGMDRLADELGFVVAYPRQTQAANAQKCWNWFKPGDQQRDRGEPALLAAITRQVVADHRLDSDRVYIAGLSAGGAAAAIMAAEYPDLYAAVGVHSGLACGAARDLPSALAAMKQGRAGGGSGLRSRGFVPVITFHGDRDMTVNEVNSQQIIAAASAAAGVALAVRLEEGRSPSGRTYRRASSVGPDGAVLLEQWTIGNAGHAWSCGDASGSYTDPKGPDASREMVRFFLERRRV
jgi:poly(hydroxyalkanoate) depolymerase family esterase